MSGQCFAVLAFVFCCSISNAEKMVEIPLSDIWALDMPGTKDVKELAKDESIKIRRELTYRAAERAAAGSCFVVTGEGREAISNAAHVLVDGAPPATFAPTGKEVTLVFYSYSAPGYVHLQSVHKSAARVIVKYKITTHRTAMGTVHFALIPLGKLSAGRVTIEVFEEPAETAYANHALTERAVCDSCTLIIQEEGTQQ